MCVVVEYEFKCSPDACHFFTCAHHAKNIKSPRQHSPTMMVSAGSSEIAHHKKTIANTKLPTPHNPRTHPRQQYPQLDRLDSLYFSRMSPTNIMLILLPFLTWHDVMRIQLFCSWQDVLLQRIAYFIDLDCRLMDNTVSFAFMFLKLSCVSRT